jgi:DcuC family C4-dicarboxylate transporter
VPICSALGFAYVLRLTGCDKHLVQLLVRPLRRVRMLLVPGGIAAGYLVNSAVVSQTGAAAVVGPILVPLLRAGGFSAATAGGLLLLGCSMGGELFNPGAVEIVTLAQLTGTEPARVVERMAGLNLLACAAALLAFWALAVRSERRQNAEAGGKQPEAPPEEPPPRVNLLKAAVPLVPLVILFAFPGLLPMPAEKGPNAVAPAAIEEARAITSSARTLVAMLIGTLAAGLTARDKLGSVVASFFEGAGFGYTHVISLIVTATTFAESIRVAGLVDALAASLGRLPGAVALGLSALATWGLAFVCGSGIAPAVAVMKALLPVAAALHLDPFRLGATVALAAHFGRTMSPAAAVVTMSATLTQTNPLELIKRVVPALLLGGLVLLLVVWLK